jgi:hypothetical protein
MLLALAVCTPLAAFAAEAEVKLFPAAGLERMEISAGSGDVVVNASTGTDVSVQVVKYDPAKCLLTLKTEGKKLVARAEQLKPASLFKHALGKDSCEAGFIVAAPAGLAVYARSGVGKLDVSGRTAATSLEDGTGDISVRGVSGDLTIKNGTGRVSGEACGGALNVHSGTGRVDLSGLCAPAEVRSGTGRITLTWAKLPAKGAVYVRSGTSDVLLTFPAGAELDLKLKSGTGSVKSDFEKKAGLAVNAESGTGNVTVAKGK